MDSAEMAVVSAQYKTVTTVFENNGAVQPKILSANPNRFSVRFRTFNTLNGVWFVFPGPNRDMPSSSFLEDNQDDYKWRDEPSVCAGEFYAICPPNGVIFIIECIYIGG